MGALSILRSSLPWQVAKMAARRPCGRPLSKGRGVLVVDDNAENRQILEEILKSWAMEPASAPGGEEALSALRDARQAGMPYRLVLTDAQMPGMSGFTLAEKIRSEPGLGNTIIMMLTSGDRLDEVAHCEELGITSYLMKPIKQSELLEATILALGVVAPAETDAASMASSAERPCPASHVENPSRRG